MSAWNQWNDGLRPQAWFYQDESPQAWMYMNGGTAAAQVIRYPPPPSPLRDPDYYVPKWPDYEPPLVLNFPVCCEGCEEKIKSRLIDIEGVRGVSVDQYQNKVTVTGTARPKEVLNACKKINRRSKWWSGR